MKQMFLITLVAILCSGTAYADGYGGGCRGYHCNNGGGSGSDVDVDVDVDSYNRNSNSNRADADARSSSTSDARSSSSATGGNANAHQGQLQGQAQQQGQAQGIINVIDVDLPESAGTRSNPITATSSGGRGGAGGQGGLGGQGGTGLGGEGGTATVGDVSTGPSTATANNSGVSATTGDTTVSSGDTTVSSGDFIVHGDDYERPAAASAASVFAGYCQNGGSGQGYDGGFSVVNESQFCDYVTMAGVWYTAYENELERCNCEVSEWAETYYGHYQDNMNSAQRLLNNTGFSGWADRFFGQMVRPLAVIGLLLLI